jgi:hypothetical protein
MKSDRLKAGGFNLGYGNEPGILVGKSGCCEKDKRG